MADIETSPIAGLGGLDWWQYNAGSEKSYLPDGSFDYDTDFRGYDPQIGRFKGVDALADALPGISTFQFGYNNPLSFQDPRGDFPIPLIAAGIGALAGGIAGYHIARNNGASPNQAVAAAFGGAIAGAAIGYGLGSINYGSILGKGGGGLQVNASNFMTSTSNTLARGIFQLTENQLIETQGRLYANETKAYNKMWELATQPKYGNLGREVGAWLTDKGVLVLPNVGVKSAAKIPSDATTANFYQFGFKNGDQYINYEGKKMFIYGSIHTHQMLSLQGKVLSSNSYILSGYDGATSGDIQFAQQATIGKPVFAIGADNSLHGYVYGDIEYKEIGSNRGRNTLRMKLYNGYWNGHTKKELEKGSFKLIPQLKKLLSKH